MRKAFLFLAMIFVIQGLDARDYSGIINPIDDIKLSLSVDGRVEEVFVKEGSQVKQGDKLIAIESDLQKFEMQMKEIIWKDRSQVEASEKSTEILHRLYRSTKKLYTVSKSVSYDELKATEMKHLTQLADAKVRRENEKKEKIEYEVSKKILSYYTLRAPIDGIVTKIDRHTGEWAKSGDVLIYLVNTSVCFLEVNIDERFKKVVSVGEALSFMASDGQKMVKVEGKVSYVAPVADRSSALVRIKIEFDNKNYGITPGVAGTIAFQDPTANPLAEKL